MWKERFKLRLHIWRGSCRGTTIHFGGNENALHYCGTRRGTIAQGGHNFRGIIMTRGSRMAVPGGTAITFFRPLHLSFPLLFYKISLSDIVVALYAYRRRYLFVWSFFCLKANFLTITQLEQWNKNAVFWNSGVPAHNRLHFVGELPTIPKLLL